VLERFGGGAPPKERLCALLRYARSGRRQEFGKGVGNGAGGQEGSFWPGMHAVGEGIHIQLEYIVNILFEPTPIQSSAFLHTNSDTSIARNDQTYTQAIT
jgi:hypothetical protein